VIGDTSDEGQVTRRQLEEVAAMVRPQPGATTDYRVHGELNGSREPNTPRGDRSRPGEDPARCAGADQVLLQDVH
jgi:hypothetical protein